MGQNQSHGSASRNKPLQVTAPPRVLPKASTDKVVECGSSEDVIFAATSMQGWRGSMEDAHDCRLGVSRKSKIDCFGVYDGHGGSAASVFAAKHLINRFSSDLRIQSGHLTKALVDAFMSTDKSFMQGYDGIDGTTAVIAVIDHEAAKLYIANAGDSRAVLCRNSQAIAMSIDHKPIRPRERDRIHAAGARVVKGRVNGILGVARALGDRDFKMGKHLSPRMTPVTAAPDVFSLGIRPSDQFLVLACDGVWDVMKNQEVVDFVLKRVKPNMTEDDVASIGSALLDQCLQNGSQDNMTATIILFNGPKHKKFLKKGSKVPEQDSLITQYDASLIFGMNPVPKAGPRKDPRRSGRSRHPQNDSTSSYDSSSSQTSESESEYTMFTDTEMNTEAEKYGGDSTTDGGMSYSDTRETTDDGFSTNVEDSV